MIKVLTPLRFLLCMMIFSLHAYNYGAGGTAAVTAFFILSGFSLTLGYRNRIISGDFDSFEYSKKRVFKLYPTHWITLVAWIIVALCFHEDGILDKHLLANIFQLQSWIPDMSYYFAYNGISWYLSTALFAYLCFPMMTMFINILTRTQRVVVFCVLMFSYGIIAYVMPVENYHAMLYINPYCRLFDFIIGIFLADMYDRVDWNNFKLHPALVDMGIIVAFLGLNLIGIFSSAETRLISAVHWLPASALILFVCLATKSSSLLSKIMSFSAIQRMTRCSFLLMMWSTVVIKTFENTGIVSHEWPGGDICVFVYNSAG